jgi:hypothetical protein
MSNRAQGQHGSADAQRRDRVRDERAAKVRRSALFFGLLAALFYVGFILFNALRASGG